MEKVSHFLLYVKGSVFSPTKGHVVDFPCCHFLPRKFTNTLSPPDPVLAKSVVYHASDTYPFHVPLTGATVRPKAVKF